MKKRQKLDDLFHATVAALGVVEVVSLLPADIRVRMDAAAADIVARWDRRIPDAGRYLAGWAGLELARDLCVRPRAVPRLIRMALPSSRLAWVTVRASSADLALIGEVCRRAGMMRDRFWSLAIRAFEGHSPEELDSR